MRDLVKRDDLLPEGGERAARKPGRRELVRRFVRLRRVADAQNSGADEIEDRKTQEFVAPTAQIGDFVRIALHAHGGRGPFPARIGSRDLHARRDDDTDRDQSVHEQKGRSREIGNRIRK